jgi:hypothetical protein
MDAPTIAAMIAAYLGGRDDIASAVPSGERIDVVTLIGEPYSVTVTALASAAPPPA